VFDHIGFVAPSREHVDAFHRTGIEAVNHNR
jgi:hypothetical protein